MRVVNYFEASNSFKFALDTLAKAGKAMPRKLVAE